MGLQNELNFPHPIQDPSHEVALAIVLTSAKLTKEADRLLRDFDLTEAQFNVLMLLAYQAGPEGISQTQLSRMLLVNRANVTGLVDRMERDGLLERFSEPGDRRKRIIRMTQKGREILEKAVQPYLERVDRIMGALSTKEREDLLKILDRLRERVG
jgi:MarR family transcriptional regulator, 2-MHQ and catechol-resistance regulon repressor